MGILISRRIRLWKVRLLEDWAGELHSCLLRCVPPFLLLFVFLPVALEAQERLSREFQLKAAFLPKFLDFVEVNGQVVAEHDKKQICILGSNPFGKVLEEIVSFQSDQVRPQIRQIGDIESVDGCTLLYISPSEQPRLNEILRSLQSTSAVTVSDISGFADQGGMIQFVLEAPYVRFFINQRAAERCGVKFSSQLLALAKRLIG